MYYFLNHHVAENMQLPYSFQRLPSINPIEGNIIKYMGSYHILYVEFKLHFCPGLCYILHSTIATSFKGRALSPKGSQCLCCSHSEASLLSAGEGSRCALLNLKIEVMILGGSRFCIFNYFIMIIVPSLNVFSLSRMKLAEKGH